MNKLLCLGLGIISSLAMISQKAVYDNPLIQKLAKVDGIPLVQYHHDLETNQISHSKSSAGETEVIFLGSSGNIYTALLPGNNQVSYNPALDAVSFVHRRNAAAPLNGVMEFDYSIDGGASWEVNQGPLSPNFADGTETGVGGGLRYPNGVLWAPEGSTNTDDAYIFSNGPTLDSDAVAWANLFEVSSKLDGTNVSETYPNYALDSINGIPTDFHPFGTSLVGDAIYSLSTQANSSEEPIFDTVTYSKFYLTKSIFDSASNSFTTEVNAIFDPTWTTLESNEGFATNYVQNYTTAWGTSGQIGYVVLIGSMPSEFGFEPVPKPHVWKTVDGGSSWYKLQEFDFQTIDAFQNTLLAPAGEQIVRPHFDTSDAVVDENGELNLFSRIRCGFSTNPDSLGFIYGAIESQDESPTEFLYHVKTDGETNWEANLISEVVNSDNAAAFSLGAIALNLKPQISRTPDGSKIFFSYHKSLQSLSLVDANIFARGYDVSTDIYTSEKNLTENTDYEDATFFQTMAPICKVGGECQMYELPIAFIEPGSDDLDECQHLYLYGAGFDDINFDPASIDEVEIDLSLNVFPNPSTGMFSLNLPNDVSGEVQVFDISGKLIHQAQNQFGLISLDLSDQPKGSYTVKYMNEKEVKTSAIIIR